jgi:pimeloyl-ACP methyl ester carboxylesterase
MSLLRRLLVALALPATLAGQAAPERASFYLIRHILGGTDTVVAERMTRTAAALTGEFVAGGARVAYTAALTPDGLVSRIEVKSYRPATDTVPTVATFTLAGDSIVVQQGSQPPVRRPGQAGVLLSLNPSVAFFEQVLLRARALGADSAAIPLYVVGAPAAVPLVATRVGADSAVLRFAGVALRFAVSPTGGLLGGVIPAQGITIARGPAVEALVAERHDYSAPAGAPYTAEEVVVRSAAGLRFTGTLTLPRERPGGRVPAIVTITGSGPEDRDEESSAIRGYRPFRELADTLGRRGIAVLRLDDRGVGGSDPGPPSATSQDFANDIRAGVAYLRGRAEIDPARIALVGHSEGGIIAPMVAATDSALRGIVLLAGTASPGREILRAQQHYAIDSMGHLSGARRDSALAASQLAMDSMTAKVPWMRFFAGYDPAEAARRVKTPVLILQGMTDRQVPPSEADKLAAAFRAGGNRDVTVRSFPATNHLFVADPVGSFEYAKLPSLHVRPEVLTAVADWLVARLH